jgi:uncharacterized protein DUF4124
MPSCCRTPFRAAFALASLLVFFLTTPVSAETYQWTDKNGSVGFADSLEKVPPEYRKSAKRFQDKSGKNFQTVPGAPASNDAAPSEYSLSQDPDYWRERMLAAHEQLEQLKVQRQQAQQAYDNLLSRRSQYLPNLDVHDVEKASSQISAVDQQIRDKEREISNMTDEARRAGIPSSALSP